MNSDVTAQPPQTPVYPARAVLRDYFRITKPRVVALIIFTAVVGMILASNQLPEVSTLLLATFGIGLAAAAGAAVNHILDEDKDQLMKRTRNRPLPSGRLESTPALIFACILAMLSMLVLTIGVNPLTAMLTFASLIGYAVIYTIFLKHATPQNIVIGGAAGAMPPVLGWTAATGELHSNAFLLFLIIFCWTPPHFWALALYRAKDYQNANIPMLPVTHGRKYTLLHILLYSILLAAVTIMPFAVGMFGLFYLASAVVLNGLFIAFALRLYISYSDLLSRKMFLYSIQYLSLMFAAMLIDHFFFKVVN